MPLELRILGAPGGDNALFVRVNSGQTLSHLLFDCGDGCASQLDFAEVARVARLFFSDLHMDHVGGFDAFFRCTFDRESPPVEVWGPVGTARVLHHRFRGFWWNLIAGSPGAWLVSDVSARGVVRHRFRASDGFESCIFEGESRHGGAIVSDPAYSVEAIVLEHCGPSLGYVVREPARQNIQTNRLQELGLRPGPWMQKLKSDRLSEKIDIEGMTYPLEELRRQLLESTPGGSVAYLTDFLLDEHAEQRLLPLLTGVDTVVCEAQYRHADLALAQKNAHTTVRQTAQLASRAGVGELVLIHLSQRYGPEEWRGMLGEARELFPAARFAEHWGLD